MNTMPALTHAAEAALDAVQQRADQRVGWPAMSPEKAGALVDALTDRRRLVAALTAVLDLHRPEKPTGNLVTDATPPYCGGCYEAGGYDDAPLWEDCPTLAAISAHMGPDRRQD